MVNPVIVWNEAILKSLTSLKIHVLSMVIDFFKLFFRWRTCCWNSMFNWLVYIVMSSTQTLRYLMHFFHHHLSWSCNIMCRCMDYIFQCRFLLCCYLGCNSTIYIVLYWNQEWIQSPLSKIDYPGSKKSL